MSLSPSSVFQYLIVAVVAYVFVGAPLLQVLLGKSDSIRTSTYDASEAVDISPAKLKTLVIPDPNLQCPPHNFNTHIFSRSPFVIYIENFLSHTECTHLQEISEPLYKPSTTYHGNTESLDPSIRLSYKAQPPRTPTVQCIESRARSFQGFHPYIFIEKLWTQKYGIGGHYAHHFDWGSASANQGRISSFMVYLEANCTGGGTTFPKLRSVEEGSEWCRFVDCGRREEDSEGSESRSEGVTWKPIKGNAVYWENFDEDGNGYEESWHAGLPVTSGTKVGLNIWSWFQRGYHPSEADRAVAMAETKGDVHEKDEL